MAEDEKELIDFAKSKGWSIKMWDNAGGLETYTKEVANKELKI